MDNILNPDLFESGSGASDRATSNFTRGKNYNKGGGSVGSVSYSHRGEKLSFRELAEKAGLQKLKRKGDYKCPLCGGKIWSGRRTWGTGTSCNHTTTEIWRQMLKDAGLWVEYQGDRNQQSIPTAPGWYLTDELREELAQSWRRGSDPELDKANLTTYPREVVWGLNFSALTGLKNIQNFLSNSYYSGSAKGWISTGHGGESANQFKPSIPYNDAKYLSRSSGDYGFFIPRVPYQPNYWEEFKADKSQPLGTTEGSKKSVALTFGYGVPSLAFFGVEMFHHKGNTELLPGLKELIEGRQIHIYLDADKVNNPNVWEATIKQYQAIEIAGGHPLIAQWDAALGKGIDDYLHNGHSLNDVELLSIEDFQTKYPKPKYQILHGIPSQEGLAKIEAKIGEPLGDRSFWEWAAVSNEPIFLTTKENTQKLLNQGYLALGASDAWRYYQKETGELHSDLSPFIRLGNSRRFYLLFPTPDNIADATLKKLGNLIQGQKQKVARVDLPNYRDDLAGFLLTGSMETLLTTNLKHLDFDSKSKELYCQTEKYDPTLITNDRYLSRDLFAQILSHRLTCIKSSKNTGKSVFIGEFLKSVGVGSINLFPVNSLAYARNCDYERIGLKSDHIKDLAGSEMEVVNGPDQHLQLCYDSLFKLTPDACDGKYLILDEASGGLFHLIFGSTCLMRRRELVERFASFCKRSRGIVLLDAGLNEETVKLIATLAEVEPEAIAKIHNLFKPNHGDIFHSLGDIDPVTGKVNPWGFKGQLVAFLDHLYFAILEGGRLALPADSKNFVKTVALLAQQMQNKVCREHDIPQREILAIHQDSKGNPNVQDFLADPSGYVRSNNPLLLTYSPTIRQGLSMESDIEFLGVYGFRFHIDTQGFTQMMERVRDTCPRYVWSAPYILPESSVKFTVNSILRGFKDSIESEAIRFGKTQKLQEDQIEKGFAGMTRSEDGGVFHYDFAIDNCTDSDLAAAQEFAGWGLLMHQADRGRFADNLADYYQTHTSAKYCGRLMSPDLEISGKYKNAKERWGYFEGSEIANASEMPIEMAREVVKNPKGDAELFAAKKSILMDALPGLEAVLCPELAIFFSEFDRMAASKLKLRWQLLNGDRSEDIRAMALDLLSNQGRPYAPYLLTDFRSSSEVAAVARDCGVLEIFEMFKEPDARLTEDSEILKAIAKKLNHQSRQWLAGYSGKKPGAAIKQLNRLLARFGYRLTRKGKDGDFWYILTDSYGSKEICPNHNDNAKFEISKIVEIIAENFYTNRETSTRFKTAATRDYILFLRCGKDWAKFLDLAEDTAEAEAAIASDYWGYLETIEQTLIGIHKITPIPSTGQASEDDPKSVLVEQNQIGENKYSDYPPNVITFAPQSETPKPIDIAPSETPKNQNSLFSIQQPSNDQNSLEPQKAISSPIDAPSDYDFIYSEEDEYGIDETANNAYQDPAYLAWVRGEEIGESLEVEAKPETKPETKLQSAILSAEAPIEYRLEYRLKSNITPPSYLSRTYDEVVKLDRIKLAENRITRNPYTGQPVVWIEKNKGGMVSVPFEWLETG